MTLTVSDVFCGAGGSSQGMAGLPGVEIKAAVNHWRRAIDSHGANFRDTEHFCVDVSSSSPRMFPNTRVLWASAECTSHSTARNHAQEAAKLTLFDPEKEAERSRATMYDVPRLAEYHLYDAIIVENVVESATWVGYRGWRASMEDLGYECAVVYWNSQFIIRDVVDGVSRPRYQPVPQSRDRLYHVFWKRGMRRPDLDLRPWARCHSCDVDVDAVQTFKQPFEQAKAKADADLAAGKRTKPLKRWGLYRSQYTYTCPDCVGEVYPWTSAAINAIDLNLPTQRIGDRGTPLAPKTRARVRKGMHKYGWQPQVVPTSHPGTRRLHPVAGEPLPTQTARAELALLQGSFVTEVRGGDPRTRSLEAPLSTLVASGNHHFLAQPFIAELRGGGSGARSTSEPLSTVTASGNHHMLVSNYTPGTAWPADLAPLGAVTAVDHHGLLSGAFVDTFNGTANPRSVAEALTTVTTLDRHALVTAPAYLVPSGGTWADRPVPVGEAYPTLTTRESYGLAQITDDDIDNCYYRMLDPDREIKLAMAFAPGYVLLGSKRERVRQLGNAVTSPTATMLLERLMAVL